MRSGERPGWVFVDEGRIVAVGSPDELPPDAGSVDRRLGRVVTPGFVDIHGHGAGGAHYQDGVDQALDALAAMRAHGTTRAVASFVTSSIDDLVASPSRRAAGDGPGPGPDRRPRRRSVPGARAQGSPQPRAALSPRPRVGRSSAGRRARASSDRSPSHRSCPGRLDAVSRFVDAGVPSRSATPTATTTLPGRRSIGVRRW